MISNIFFDMREGHLYVQYVYGCVVMQCVVPESTAFDNPSVSVTVRDYSDLRTRQRQTQRSSLSLLPIFPSPTPLSLSWL